ncbi:MAG: hypothetical protein ACOCP8_06265 [archaeon]
MNKNKNDIIKLLNNIIKDITEIEKIWEKSDINFETMLNINYTFKNDLSDVRYQFINFKSNLKNNFTTEDELHYTIKHNADVIIITQRNNSERVMLDNIISLKDVNFQEIKIKNLVLKKDHINHILSNINY